MRRVQRPVQHLAGFEIEHLRMPVVPGRVRQIDLDVEQRDVLEVLRPDERRGVWIDIDPLAAGDLDQALPRQIGMIIDLRIRRGDQNAGLVVRHYEARNLGRDLLEHPVDQLAVAAVDRADIAHVEPEATPGNRLDDLPAGEVADIALAPHPAGALGTRLHQAVVFARIVFDQLRELVHRERRRFVHLVFEPDRLMAPKLGMRLIPCAEDLARHRRAPADFPLLPPPPIPAVPKSRPAAIAVTARCPVMRRPDAPHGRIGKNGAGRARPLTGS